MLNSCQFFTINKKNTLQELDTIVDFSAVDVSPTFAVCDSLIDKKLQNQCFRKTIHQKVLENLSKYHFEVTRAIDDEVKAIILIDKKGDFHIEEIKSSILIHMLHPNIMESKLITKYLSL